MKSKIKADFDKDSNAMFIYREGEDHIGASEELNLLGADIIIDRNKKGIVKAVEVILFEPRLGEEDK